MDHFSYLIDRQHRFLLFGIILLIWTGMHLVSGETLTRYRGFVSRADEPKLFWWNVGSCFVGALLFFATYIYQNWK